MFWLRDYFGIILVFLDSLVWGCWVRDEITATLQFFDMVLVRGENSFNDEAGVIATWSCVNITAVSGYGNSRTLIRASSMPVATIALVVMGPAAVGIVILPVCVRREAFPVAVNVYELSAGCNFACSWGM